MTHLEGRTSAILDDGSDARRSRLAALSFERLYDLHALGDFSEHDVLTVQPRRLDGRNEELRAVRVASSIRHGKQSNDVVLEVEILVRKTLAINRLSSTSVTTSDVASLDHEVGDDLKNQILQTQRHSTVGISQKRRLKIEKRKMEPKVPTIDLKNLTA